MGVLYRGILPSMFHCGKKLWDDSFHGIHSGSRSWYCTWCVVHNPPVEGSSAKGWPALPWMMRVENREKKIAPSVPSHPNQYIYPKEPQTSTFLVIGCTVSPQIHVSKNVTVSEDVLFMPEWEWHSYCQGWKAENSVQTDFVEKVNVRPATTVFLRHHWTWEILCFNQVGRYLFMALQVKIWSNSILM